MSDLEVELGQMIAPALLDAKVDTPEPDAMELEEAPPGHLASAAAASTLAPAHRIRARDLAVEAAVLGYHHRAAIHYNQGSHRWDGITERLLARKGHYPTSLDCSAFVTWCLWNGLHYFHMADVVNHGHWLYGNTATIIQHGRPVARVKDLMRGDAVLYGKNGVTSHVAICVGQLHGEPMVVSHGQESGPLYLPAAYREITAMRRHIP